MSKITTARRAVARSVLASSNQYDADTMVITRAGMVTAFRDADKIASAPKTIRYDVGHIDDMVAADGSICDGYHG